jgi:WD40 repeat protein/transcriptional regulator with XRE-family HTH domain
MAEQPGLGFAGLLRQLRAQARLTQEELAESAGISPRSVSDLERGINRTARKDTAELLAGALGLAEPVRASFVAAARGRAPAAEVLAAMREQAAPGSGPVWEGCPYLGLVPFDEGDARVFYGRGELVAQLVQRVKERLDEPGILLVAGESGTGKSSLLRAGLMPRLAAGALGPGSERWPRRVIRPTASPLGELAMQLADVAGTDPVSVYRSLRAAPDETPTFVELAVRTATGHGANTRSAGQADSACEPPRLVLVVDQFEELFTAGWDTDASRLDREAFIAALHAAATVPAGPQKIPPTLAIIAVRADFLGRLIAYPPLKAALDAGPFTVGPMSEAELRLAITGPAAEAGLVVEPALVEAVIAELREGAGGGLGSGVLPLMSQAMAETWEHREGDQLALRAYRRAGGVADAVNRTAQATYDALTDRQQKMARLVFTQLTVITPDGQFARRRCSMADLHFAGEQVGDIDAVIDAFSAQRLLVLGQDSVEIVHDVLLQAWKQLRDWLGDDQFDRALYSQVITDADTWDSNGRDASYLYRSGRLATVDAATGRWQNASARYPPLPATSQAFLDAAHHAARRGTQRRRTGFAVLALLTALAVAASGFAFSQRATAIRQRDQAIYNQVVAEALQLSTSNTPLAAQLTLAAYRIQPTEDLASRLLNTENTPLPASLAVGSGSVNSVAFSRDGRTLASGNTELTSGNSEGTVRLWNVADPAHPSPLGQPLPSGPGAGPAAGTAAVQSVAFSPTGNTLASSDTAGNLQLWDVADRAHPHLLAPIPIPNGAVAVSIAFSPDGRTLASGDIDGTIRLWDVADPARSGPVGSSMASSTNVFVDSVAFSPDGRTLASGDSDGTVRLWDVADPAHPRQVGPGLPSTAAVQAVAFSPDGRTLASGDSDGTIRLWDVADPARSGPVGPSLASGGAIDSVAFSPDGRMLASGSPDGTISLWDVADPVYPSQLGPGLTGGGAIESVAFSPDGRTLASGGLDGFIRLWNLPQTVLTGGTGAIVSVAFSPGSHTLGSADSGGTVRLWDVADPAHPRPAGPVLIGGTSVSVGSIAFSPEGRTLASGNSDGTVRLWDVADPARPRRVGPVLTDGTGVPIDSVAFSPDGRTLASGDSGGSIWLWDVADLAHARQVGSVLTDGTGAPIGSVAFSPDGHLLASGDYNGGILLWDVADPVHPSQRGLAFTGGGAAVYSLAFSPDGRTLASGGHGDTIRLWDVADPARPQQLGQPLIAGGDRVGSVAFSPGGHTLASGSSDGTIRLWDVTEPVDPQPLGQPLTSGSIPVDSVAFSPDGHTLASGSGDGTTRLWNLNVQYAIQRICTAAGGLTPQQWNQYIRQLRYQPSCVH